MNRGILLLVGALACGPVAAQQAYIGAGVGQSDVDELNDTDTAFKVFLGVHVNPNLALEGGLVSFGETTANYGGGESISADAAGAYGAVVGRLPVGAATVYGKVGLQYWDVDLVVCSAGMCDRGSDTGIDPMLGVGLEIPMVNRVAVRAEFERYLDVSDGVEVFDGYARSTGTDVDVITVGLRYSF